MIRPDIELMLWRLGGGVLGVAVLAKLALYLLESRPAQAAVLPPKK